MKIILIALLVFSPIILFAQRYELKFKKIEIFTYPDQELIDAKFVDNVNVVIDVTLKFIEINQDNKTTKLSIFHSAFVSVYDLVLSLSQDQKYIAVLSSKGGKFMLMVQFKNENKIKNYYQL